jgi:nicotinamide-nucleotide amidase
MYTRIAMDNNTSIKIFELATSLGLSLQKQQMILALAESCTGGLASAAITEVAGSSSWFDCGLITYSNTAKQNILGVKEYTLTNYGAVSEETALEMALGALKNSQANIAGSITGIAGPSGGSESKPVGTVCFAWATLDGIEITTTMHFIGSRQAVRQQSVITAITGLLDLLKN